MKTISLAKLHAIAPERKPGYIDAVMAVAEPVSDTHVRLSDQDFDRLRAEYAVPVPKSQPPKGSAPKPQPSGPGTELKKLLATIGIHATPTCSCNKMAKQMDAWGWEESLKHIDEIVTVMEETAKKRKLPFVRTAGKTLVRIACWKAKRAGNSK
jgi:hypothetical protein